VSGPRGLQAELPGQTPRKGIRVSTRSREHGLSPQKRPSQRAQPQGRLAPVVSMSATVSSSRYLAWGAGYARIHGRQFGWISDLIPQDQVKAEFRRLAKKYDAMP